jgi:hypothetical protein
MGSYGRRLSVVHLAIVACVFAVSPLARPSLAGAPPETVAEGGPQCGVFAGHRGARRRLDGAIGLAPMRSNLLSRDDRYNQGVRTWAAVLMLVVFASLNAIDRICCPDGCTHEESASLPTGAATEGACVLCTGGLQSPVLHNPTFSALVASDVARIATRSPVDVPPDPPEHPPRS